MARYSKVDSRLWLDRKFNALSERARYLWLFLLTGPDVTSLPGVLVGGIGHFAEILGWSKRKFVQAFGELEELGMAVADFENRVVWLPKAATYNPPQSPNVIVSWGTLWDLVPECGLKAQIWRHLRAAVQAMSEAFRAAFAESLEELAECEDLPSAPSRPLGGKPFGKAFGNQKQKQKQKQEQNITEVCPVRFGRGPESTGPHGDEDPAGEAAEDTPEAYDKDSPENGETRAENTYVSEPGEKTDATGPSSAFRQAPGHETHAATENDEKGQQSASNRQVTPGGETGAVASPAFGAKTSEHHTLREHGSGDTDRASGKASREGSARGNDLSGSLVDSLNTASGKPIGGRPESLPGSLSDGDEQGTVAFQLVSPGPSAQVADETAQTRRTSVAKTKKYDADLSRDELTDREVDALDAMLEDETIKSIVRRPAQLARDLCRAAPGVDVAVHVKRAGGWLRANPSRAKHNGNRFLLNWMVRQQDRGGGYGSSSSGSGQRLRAPNAYPVQEGTMADIEAVWRRTGVGEHVIYTSENQPSEEEVDRVLKEQLIKCGMWDEAKEEV